MKSPSRFGDVAKVLLKQIQLISGEFGVGQVERGRGSTQHALGSKRKLKKVKIQEDW